MILKIKYKKNAHQQQFQDDIKTKFLHLSGGYGSGKSFALCQKAFQLSRLNKGLPGGLVCPSYTDFRRDVYELMQEICELNRIKYHYHQTQHWYLFPWSQGKLFVATGEKHIKGPNWAYALINELTLLKFQRYQEIISRVRLKKAAYPQIASGGTPEGLLTGYYEFFIEKPNERSRVIYGDTRANLMNLQEGYDKDLASAYDSQMLEAYMSGRFINMLGNRFYYAYEPEKHDDVNMVEREDYPVMCSMDFNVDPMVATIWQWQPDGGIGAVNEIILKQNADTNKMAAALKDQGYHPDRTEIYPDPSGNARSTKGQPDTVILRNHGFYNIKVRAHAPTFRKRQLNVCNIMEKGKMSLNPKTCPWLKRDLLLCTQDPSTLEKEKSSKELTHSSDGMDYLFDLQFEFSGKKPETRIIRIR